MGAGELHQVLSLSQWRGASLVIALHQELLGSRETALGRAQGLVPGFQRAEMGRYGWEEQPGAHLHLEAAQQLLLLMALCPRWISSSFRNKKTAQKEESLVLLRAARPPPCSRPAAHSGELLGLCMEIWLKFVAREVRKSLRIKGLN